MSDARVTKFGNGVKLDLRRCKRCGKIPQGRMQKQNSEMYDPYCSYHCQEWARLEDATEYIRTLKGNRL